MKVRIVALILALSLPLSGCAQLLERSYTVVEPHVGHPAAGEDASITAKTYSELVSSVLYLVSTGTEEGVIRLVDYKGEVDADLNRACLEVAQDDPLGAYAVEFIRSEYTRILTTYEATISITYRRTPEQVHSLINVTGAAAIRREVGSALTQFHPELALRVGYLTEDEASIIRLVRQAYYDNPSCALGLPDIEVALYPDSGQRRIVEILLTYPEDTESLRQKQADVLSAAEELLLPVLYDAPQDERDRLALLLERLPDALTYAPAAGNTVWDALVGSGADDEGLALAFQLLCGQMELEGSILTGSLEGNEHFWNAVVMDGETGYIDPSRGDWQVFSGGELAELGYDWER